MPRLRSDAGRNMILLALFLAALLAGLSLFALDRSSQYVWGMPVGGAALVGAVMAICTALVIGALPREDVDADPGSTSAAAERELRLLDEQTALLRQIHEHTMLSEGSKRLLYRTKELDLLRHAIEEDIARGDYDAALTMCTTMAEEFGFRSEAEAFRETIESMRREHYEKSLQESMATLEAAIAEHDWAAARQEAARVRRLFPEAGIVEELDARIEAARESHKAAMIERFVAAAEHGEDETAMRLLRELDRYLTREDATRLHDTAQGVVGRHRENLSVQFNIAVRDRNWAEAVRVGNDIVREFPNSKMAEEVRSMIEVLQTRATHAAVHAASGAV